MRETHINEQKDKKIGDYTLSLPPEEWHKLYVSRKEGRRGLDNKKDRVVAIQRIEGYIEKNTEKPIKAGSNSNDEKKNNRTRKQK